MIVGVLKKSIVVMIGGNLKKNIIVMMIGGNLKKSVIVMMIGVLRKNIVMMIGGNLKKSVIVMMIGVLNEISVVVNVSLFVAIVKGRIGNIFDVNLKTRICLLEPIGLFRKVDPTPTSLLSLNFEVGALLPGK
ncbi:MULTISPECIES: hypothetical protein [unclassified Bacillus cereus group]|uniref:hypothetical protein n=1 Tax=unclassified Bacillus cereus group TaxID=2750818 RepID=UPI0022DF2DF5|nr:MULTISPECIES: hypothetical protein [unclassified Bacillus cereus group]MDA1652212.1 hypothetical protein [Bacillus cereus group sp. TH160LC]MDA1801959.1 hypothetical protein [Bacillus cereus group sp. BY6-1LC]